MRTDKKEELGEPIRASSTLMLPPGVVRKPVRPRPRAGPEPVQMSQRKILELQERIHRAIRAELPDGWEFMCCITGPSGEKEVFGSLHPTPENRNFLKALADAMPIKTWRS